MTQPTPDQIREFVIAGHGNLPKVQALLAENPALLHVAQAWSETDHETAIQAAAHVGARPVAEFLLAQGAELALPTAAMLGDEAAVERLLVEKPERITEPGAHGIPLLPHAVFSGNAEFVASLHGRGAVAGASMALAHTAGAGHTEVVRWLLAHANPDLTWKNWQEKTAREIAEAGGHGEIVELLK
jgi:ankyrin repeat protein